MAWERSQVVVQQICAGSPDAEHELAERFLPRVRAFLGARTGNADWVEELTQETVLAAICALRAGRLRQGEALEAFILGIARNRLAEAFRQLERTRTEPLPEDNETGRFSSPSVAPEWVLAARKEMADLGETDRRILWLLLAEGARPREVGAIVGMSEDSVRQRKSRLLRRLAGKLGVPPVTTKTPGTTLGRTPV
ncbi:MAG TPA: sigma-70 family RNA polymerase sigma factor [Bryobacteraceae bacterium]|nr:sigma-70 family RNA polymerase sigma factor [Bryobacteraceae bacterium]